MPQATPSMQQRLQYGKDTAIEGKSTNEVSGDYKTYTETFDLSAQNVKYFTLFNNKAGALYIEKIIITLK